MMRLVGMVTASVALASAPAWAAPDAGAIHDAIQPTARSATCRAGDGIGISGGRVVAAAIYDRMEGFARQVGTTGGLGQRYLEVTRLDDDPGVGTLRWAVGEAGRGGGWIGFSKRLRPGAEIALGKGLRLTGNTTIDGGCIAPLITAPTRTSVIYIQRTSNVVLTRIRVSQSGPPVSGKAGGDCVTVSHGADKVWIGYSEFFRCTDGLVDITQTGVHAAMRATVSHDYFHDHDKAMLISGDDCASTTVACLKVEPGAGSEERPLVQVTLQGNIFSDTGQRHPRVSGHAYVHVVDDVVLYGARRRVDGSSGAAYGAFAANGGMIFAENSLYLPLSGAATKPAINAQDSDTQVSGRGAVRTRGMSPSAARSLSADADVAAPSYTLRSIADFTRDPVAAARCVSERAGVGGWETPADAPCDMARR